MNIVFDQGLNLEEGFREALAPLLPMGNAPLRLDAYTAKTDGTINADEGIVFITHLPVDILKYHASFFMQYKDAPQWFLVLLSKDDHNINNLEDASRKFNLKNCKVIFAGNRVDTFEEVVKEIQNTKPAVKGKTLLLSAHKRDWVSDFARLLFGNNESKYQIMTSANMTETDSDVLFLCGEIAEGKVYDFRGVDIPENMEPYFIFNYKSAVQHYINPKKLVTKLADDYHMTTERVESRLCFVDVESEMWLSCADKTAGAEAVARGILLWDEFGLPVSRKKYTEENIAVFAHKNHETFEKIKKTILSL